MSCSAVFQEYVDHLKRDRRNVLTFKLVSNQRSGVCSYATGDRLWYQPEETFGDDGPFPVVRPAEFRGEADQLFDDRLAAGGNPFDVSAADKILVRVILAENPTLQVRLLSWGTSRVTAPLECRNGVFMGSAPASTFVLSVQPTHIPEIRPGHPAP